MKGEYGMNRAPLTTWLSEPRTLRQLQGLVGGYVEVVYLPTGDQMLVDEEGILKNKKMNITASRLANKPIYGDAVILTGNAKWV